MQATVTTVFVDRNVSVVPGRTVSCPLGQIAPLILEPEEGDEEEKEATRAENCSFQSIKSTQLSRGQD